MRKSNQEIKDKDTIEQILKKAKICRIAMKDGETPYLLPFNYGYYQKQLYIHSAPEGKKLKLLSENNDVCFEVEDDIRIIENEHPCKWSTAYRSVIGNGKIQIINVPEQKREALKIIMAQHGADGDMHFDEGQVKSLVIIKVEITSLTAKQSGNWDRLVQQSAVNLESTRLRLKELAFKDVRNIHRLHSIPEVDEFNTLGIPASLNDSENQRSIKVLEKCGMTREGLRRKILPIRGKWTDSYHYAIVEDDPRNW